MAELLVLSYAAVSGSDTAASGEGPATAKTGSSATNGTGNVVNLDGTPDLSGVAVDDLIWVNSATTNRHLSRITAVNDGADTVTTEDLLVLGGGVSWAIGGERKTHNNDTGRFDWEDWKDGWTMEYDDSGTYANDVEVTPNEAGSDATGPMTIRAAAGSTLPNWTHADGANEKHLAIPVASARFNIIGMHISTAEIWTGGSAIEVTGANSVVNISFTEIEGLSTGADGHGVEVTTSVVVNVWGCRIHGAFTKGILHSSGGRATGIIQGNWIDGCSDAGIHFDSKSSFTSRIALDNIISNCGGAGIDWEGASSTAFNALIGNSIYSCADGIKISGVTTAQSITVRNNILSDNSGWGINAVTAANGDATLADFNAFFSNTSGELNNAAAGDNDVTLTADPFTNAASDDFTLNNTAGGGADCKDAGFPSTFLGMGQTAGVAIGARQAAAAGGGGGMIVHPGMTGGFHG